MKVFKFGGASVQSAEGVKNLASIVSTHTGNMVIVVSAMGKTTNALEKVVNAYLELKSEEAFALLDESKHFHLSIINQLFKNNVPVINGLSIYFDAVQKFINENRRFEYDYCYDQIVPLGELASTYIVSSYLYSQNIRNKFLDIRDILRTDSTFREANIRLDESQQNMRDALDFTSVPIYLTQGFIGSNNAGHSTTLGREGSDYTAAVIASLINAESVTIWKDVPGILNADPRIFKHTTLLPAVSYKEAAELSFYGAQIIHPKTIKPIHNKGIPLYVKSFVEPQTAGTVIAGNSIIEREIPVYILKKNQVLISILPKDFSFALEQTLVEVFNQLLKHRIKVNLIQSSAVSISVCVDETRNVQPAIDEFMNDYKIRYNYGVELLTIRNYTSETIAENTAGAKVYLEQKTRRTVRIIMSRQTD